MATDIPPIATSITDRINRLAHGLRSGALFLEIVAVVSIIGGVVVGIGVALQTSTTADSLTRHPYVINGILVMVGATIGGIFYWCVARALRLFAEHVALTHGVDLDYRAPRQEKPRTWTWSHMTRYLDDDDA
jgi:hypothetical protein